MGRRKATLSALQEDPVAFPKMCWDIRAIGVLPLSRLGLVNRESISKWAKKKPVETETEQALIESIKRWKNLRDAQGQHRLEEAREVVEM